MKIEHSSPQEDYTKEILYVVLTNAVPYQLEFLPIVEIPLSFLQVTHLYKDARRHSCTCVYSQRQQAKGHSSKKGQSQNKRNGTVQLLPSPSVYRKDGLRKDFVLGFKPKNSLDVFKQRPKAICLRCFNLDSFTEQGFGLNGPFQFYNSRLSYMVNMIRISVYHILNNVQTTLH